MGWYLTKEAYAHSCDNYGMLTAPQNLFSSYSNISQSGTVVQSSGASVVASLAHVGTFTLCPVFCTDSVSLAL